MGKYEKKAEENKRKGKSIKVYCAECSRETKHAILQSYDEDASESFDNDTFSVDWSNSYQIIECQGCESVSFRHQSWCSEDQEWYGPDDYSDGTKERLYPKRSASTLPCSDFMNVPVTLRRLYRETISCYNEESFTLCAAGLRAIVEGICADQKILDGPVNRTKADGTVAAQRRKNLEGKISGLCEKGILTKSNAEILHEHRFLGNEAVHELAQPSQKELLLAVQIIEHMLEALYEIPEKALELRKQKARRQKKKP